MRQDPHRLVGGAAGELAHAVDEVVRLLIDAAEVGIGASLAVLRADRALPPIEGLGALAVEQVGELVANLALAGAGAQVVGGVERALEHHVGSAAEVLAQGLLVGVAERVGGARVETSGALQPIAEALRHEERLIDRPGVALRVAQPQHHRDRAHAGVAQRHHAMPALVPDNAEGALVVLGRLDLQENRLCLRSERVRVERPALGLELVAIGGRRRGAQEILGRDPGGVGLGAVCVHPVGELAQQAGKPIRRPGCGHALGAPPRHHRLARHPQRALDALAAHLALQRALDQVGDLRLVDLAADAHLQQEAVDRRQQVTPHGTLATGGRFAQLGQDFVHEAVALDGGLQILGVALELGVVVDHTRPSGGDFVVALGGELGQSVAQRLPAAIAQHVAQAVVLADFVKHGLDHISGRAHARRVEVGATLVRLVPGGQAARVARADIQQAPALERGNALLAEALDQRGAELRGRQAGDGVGGVAAGQDRRVRRVEGSSVAGGGFHLLRAEGDEDIPRSAQRGSTTHDHPVTAFTHRLIDCAVVPARRPLARDADIKRVSHGQIDGHDAPGNLAVRPRKFTGGPAACHEKESFFRVTHARAAATLRRVERIKVRGRAVIHHQRTPFGVHHAAADEPLLERLGLGDPGARLTQLGRGRRLDATARPARIRALAQLALGLLQNVQQVGLAVLGQAHQSGFAQHRAHLADDRLDAIHEARRLGDVRQHLLHHHANAVVVAHRRLRQPLGVPAQVRNAAVVGQLLDARVAADLQEKLIEVADDVVAVEAAHTHMALDLVQNGRLQVGLATMLIRDHIYRLAESHPAWTGVLAVVALYVLLHFIRQRIKRRRKVEIEIPPFLRGTADPGDDAGGRFKGNWTEVHPLPRSIAED